LKTWQELTFIKKRSKNYILEYKKPIAGDKLGKTSGTQQEKEEHNKRNRLQTAKSLSPGEQNAVIQQTCARTPETNTETDPLSFGNQPPPKQVPLTGQQRPA
jgi:hypothetical protein